MSLIKSRYFIPLPRDLRVGGEVAGNNCDSVGYRSNREAGAAPAALGRVRIDEVEPLPHERLLVVEDHAVQVDEALGVDEDPDRRRVGGGRIKMRLRERVD